MATRRTLMKIAGLSGLALATRSAAIAAEPFRNAVIVNTLGGLGDYNAKEVPGRSATFLKLSPRIIADAKASRVTAMNITLGHVAGPGDTFEITVDDIAAAEATIRSNPQLLIKVLKAADIGKAHANGKIGIIYGFQNGTMLGDEVSRVDLFADLGVKIFQLTYNEDNGIGGGSRNDSTGLTPFGREIVAAINRRKAIVDVSHGSHLIGMDAVAVSTQPVAITHTACRALRNIPRNTPDELLKAIANKGGYVGIVTGGMFLSEKLEATPEDFAAHVEHAINICGEDHVGIGTDNPITGLDDFEAFRKSWSEAAEKRRAAGVGSVGETSGLPFVNALMGPDQFRTMVRAFEARRFTAARIEKILGKNFVRYAASVWGA